MVDEEECSVVPESQSPIRIEISDTSDNDEPPVLSPVKPIQEPIETPNKKVTKKKRSVKPKLPPVIRSESSDVEIVGVYIPKPTHGRTKQTPAPYQPGRLDDIRLFFEHAKSLNSDPLLAFRSLRGAVLCGYFERLIKSDKDDMYSSEAGTQEENVNLYCRFSTDLPEMITCCIYEAGRYALWRDDPTQSEVLIVHVTNEDHFPHVTLVGDRMEHLLYHLANKELEPIKAFLPAGYSMARIAREVNEVRKERNTIKVGSVPTGIGIHVPSTPKSEYQEIAAAGELKKIIIQIGEDEKEFKERAEEQMAELYNCIELANNEGFYGMSLELGQWLWLANYRPLSDKAREALVTAYTNLKREGFIEIVNEHHKKKEEEWQEEEDKENRKRENAEARKELRKRRRTGTETSADSNDYEPHRYFTRHSIQSLSVYKPDIFES